jgi:NADP-dependent 3-hydroxy acid dehydrogenase YdfG
MELEGWNRLVDINLNGVLYCMRAVLPAMLVCRLHSYFGGRYQGRFR